MSNPSDTRAWMHPDLARTAGSPFERTTIATREVGRVCPQTVCQGYSPPKLADVAIQIVPVMNNGSRDASRLHVWNVEVHSTELRRIIG